MNRFAALLIGSALTSLIASHGFAADAQPSAAAPAKQAPAETAATTAPATPAAPAAQPPAAKDEKIAQAPTAGKEVKVGFITLNKVASETAEGKAATGKLSVRSAKLREKIDAKQKQLEKQKAAIESKLPTMTPKERQTKGTEFQKKVEDFQKMVRASESEMAEMQEKLTSQVYAQIKEAATAYGKANGFAIVVEEKAVLYLAEELKPKDLTAEIIQYMDKKPAK
ncbi:outer membrane channel, putative [Citrifermentans bemidjiense Bem]|uniref:Outer membrane channel, putative n=1 Tax=Citrifermentans bemidjiense (strain ATCC BAA-1014 / DSM 16622 / JCM 12645 / Bem) TaxID=404380 RepID=B5ECS1_CITBB|nr:OmpH family outer membrane protein [Citrifermentans bemidjiense]ACH39106.1 outer membrane channel, putative [Citrifermentans bemidjiense Bem]